jgi:hypothetical protein
MNHRYLLLPVTILLVVFLVNCSKEKEDLPETELVFNSLVAEKDTIAPGESTPVKASATGSNLEFFWEATLGDIIGSGPEITYVASPCAVGTNEITCKVTNGNQWVTKSIEITVYE